MTCWPHPIRIRIWLLISVLLLTIVLTVFVVVTNVVVDLVIDWLLHNTIVSLFGHHLASVWMFVILHFDSTDVTPSRQRLDAWIWDSRLFGKASLLKFTCCSCCSHSLMRTNRLPWWKELPCIIIRIEKAGWWFRVVLIPWIARHCFEVFKSFGFHIIVSMLLNSRSCFCERLHTVHTRTIALQKAWSIEARLMVWESLCQKFLMWADSIVSLMRPRQLRKFSIVGTLLLGHIFPVRTVKDCTIV